jgi:parallel beta-helix repeat protein
MSTSPEIHGAIGDGIADDTVAWQLAIATGEYVTAAQDAIYLVAAPLGGLSPGQTIDLNGAQITSTYDNTGTYPNWSAESLFLADGAHGASIRDGRLQHSTAFTSSHEGNINGVHVINTDDFSMKGISARGFNGAGLSIGMEGAYCRKPKVEDCDLSQCRIAGSMIGNTDGLVFRRNRGNENGLMSDGGTGYGIAASSSKLPKNTTVEDNEFNDNARKGLDLHSGDGGRLSRNEIR